MTNTHHHSRESLPAQHLLPETRRSTRYTRNAISKKYRRQVVPNRVKPNFRQLLLDSHALRGTQLTVDEVEQLVRVIGPALKLCSAGRPFEVDSLWGLHRWGRHLTSDDLDTLEAVLLAIRARLDPILRAGHQRVTDEHYCVSMMLADLGEERDWRRADPTRAPVAQRTKQAMENVNRWFAGTSFDAGVVV
jgi:hypothetical protein